MKTTSFQLGSLNSYVQEEIATGEYKNASEVIREGLRLLKSERDKVKLLRTLIAEGEASGWIEIDQEEHLKRLHAKHKNK